MKNRKNSRLAITMISLITMTTGCGITITKNYYYTHSYSGEKKSNEQEIQIDYIVDSLVNSMNEQER